tara:strand:+ start:3044 stop:4345 length:1302 start_codon:yes stop_codon:yes gene_type:complete
MTAPPIKFTPSDLTNPQGKNGLSSLALYYQRLLYKEKIYPTGVVAPLDTWYDKQYYGKIDRLQNTISLKQNRLKVPRYAAKPDIYLLDFVADAFDAFSAHMADANVIGIANPAGNKKMIKVAAKRGYNSSLDHYKKYLNLVYKSFIEVYPRFSSKIRDFRSFTELFVEYLLEVAPAIPVTLTNYTLSSAIDIFSSGLCVSIDQGQFDVDEWKYEKYLTDPNFVFYVRCAKKYGFTVNKNIPWLLTADLFTDAIMKYVVEYETEVGATVDEDNFFGHYYEYAHMMDLPLLKTFLVNSYNQYITLNPFYEERIYRPGCDKFQLSNRERPPTSYVEDILTDKYLANLYLNLRSVEAAEPLAFTTKLRSDLGAIHELRPNQNLTGLENIVEYINLIYRDYIYGIDYPLINENVFKNLDNQIRQGKISTAGSITQQLY